MHNSQRIRQHSALSLFSILFTLGVYFLIESKDATFRLSMATAYASLVLIGWSLMLGPWNVFRNRPNPVSSDLRRDVGIWGGILGLIHFVLGLQVHMGGNFWLYFVYPAKESHLIPLRHDAFGFANYTGLGSTFVLILLLALSNNRSLRQLGTQKWKSLQRWNYLNFLLVVLHGVAYQFLERRVFGFILLFAVMVLSTMTIQLAGFQKIRHGKAFSPLEKSDRFSPK